MKKSSDYIEKYEFTFSTKLFRHVLWNSCLLIASLSCAATPSNLSSFTLEISFSLLHSVFCHLIILLPLTMKPWLWKYFFVFSFSFFFSFLFLSLFFITSLYLAVRSFSGVNFLNSCYRHNISAHTSPNTSLPMAGGLELNYIYGLFQLKPSYDSKIMEKKAI